MPEQHPNNFRPHLTQLKSEFMINNKKENDGKNGVDGKIPKAKTTADKIDINKYLDKPQDL